MNVYVLYISQGSQDFFRKIIKTHFGLIPGPFYRELRKEFRP